MGTFIIIYEIISALLLIPKQTRKLARILLFLPVGIIAFPLMIIFKLTNNYK